MMELEIVFRVVEASNLLDPQMPAASVIRPMAYTSSRKALMISVLLNQGGLTGTATTTG